jgi:N-acetylglucosaminyldiphosphoundecaprenol N-acetyl-beta-D-mannosaminyltransferase
MSTQPDPDNLSQSLIYIGDIPFIRLDYESTMELFSQWRRVNTARQVCIVNVHTLVTAHRDPGLKRVMHSAALNTMDGQPLRWYANLVRKARLSDRVCGPELMLRCLDKGRQQGWKHYLLGGKKEVLQTLEDRIKKEFPGTDIVGAESPPFRPLTESEDRELVERINVSGADFLWVGLGAPKQEFWISDHLERLKTPINIGVGAAFDFHAGEIDRAPAWMQRLGLEWVHRIVHDPRLWSRYLSTNPPFLWMLVRDFFKYRTL